MSTRIYVTGVGGKRYVGGTITETAGKDISGATYTIALNGSKDTPPTIWLTPDVSVAGASSSQRVVKLLVNATPPGVYYCWVRIADTPEIEPIMIQGNITVI